MKKKAQGMPLNIIIIAILLLVVLVVLIVIFTRKTGQFAEESGSCALRGGTCGPCTEDVKARYMTTEIKASDCEVCCIKIYEKTAG